MIKPEFKDALCIVNGGKFPIITHENSASSYKAVFSWHGNDIYIYIKTNRVKLCLSRWIFSRHAATSFSAYAPHSSAWRCSYWTHPWFSKLKVCIRSIGTTRITRSSICFVHLINQGVPHTTWYGTICQSWNSYARKVAWSRGRIGIAENVFLQNFSDPSQDAEGQVQQSTRVCFKNWTPHILQQ